jgi:polar amino acid transport system substrate-binding protein
MRKIILGIVLLSMSILNALDLMTEDYPPYNYTNEKGLPTGISVDIVKDIIKKTGDKDNITIVPWARSYHDIQIKKNQVLFVMTRTKQRENLFKWVGPLASNNWVIFANKNFKGTISSLEELKSDKYTIGTYKDDACELFLKEKNFKNFSSVPQNELNVKKLARNRIDFWITGEYQGILTAKRFNKLNKIKKVFNVKDTQLYIAFSKDVDDSIINRWQKELDILKANGKYQKILDKYLK